jgi:predicted RNase H-like nuclease
MADDRTDNDDWMELEETEQSPSTVAKNRAFQHSPSDRPKKKGRKQVEEIPSTPAPAVMKLIDRVQTILAFRSAFLGKSNRKMNVLATATFRDLEQIMSAAPMLLKEVINERSLPDILNEDGVLNTMAIVSMCFSMCFSETMFV